MFIADNVDVGQSRRALQGYLTIADYDEDITADNLSGVSACAATDFKRWRGVEADNWIVPVTLIIDY